MDSFDGSLKHLVTQNPGDFIAFGLHLKSVEVLQPLPLTLPARKRDLDGGYLIRLHNETRVVHLEYHRRHQRLEELAIDVAEAQIRLYRRESVTVLSQVWDLYGTRSDPLLEDRVLEYGMSLGDKQVKCQSVYRRVNLRAESWQALLHKAPPALWPLVPLTRDGATKEVVLTTRDAIEGRTDLSPVQQADHLTILNFVAEREGLPRALLLEYISKRKMMESELYREIFSEGEARGEAKGRADSLVRLLVRRLGELDQAVSRHIRAESRIEVLDLWLDTAMAATSKAALRRLLEQIRITPLPQPE